ncbi:MAG: IS200/IS605 family transposase [Chitinophagales bacterium]|nr:IS200/IS605 family transposase [Chitinophagales bacterium]
MPNSYARIWIHAIWSTKKRLPIIHPSYEVFLFRMMSDEFRQLGCPVRIVNGMPDHVHCLYLQNPKISATDTIKQIKGSSSYFINEEGLCEDGVFEWQRGFAALSVSDESLNRVYNYIRNQKQHHNGLSFKEEYRVFREKIQNQAGPFL